MTDSIPRLTAEPQPSHSSSYRPSFTFSMNSVRAVMLPSSVRTFASPSGVRRRTASLSTYLIAPLTAYNGFPLGCCPKAQGSWFESGLLRTLFRHSSGTPCGIRTRFCASSFGSPRFRWRLRRDSNSDTALHRGCLSRALRYHYATQPKYIQ